MMTTTAIENALNAALSGNQSTAVAAHNIAQAIVDTVKLAQINYTTGLIAPPGTAGGPVTGALTTATLT